MKLVFASNNLNKLKEIQVLLPTRFELLTLDDIGFNKDIEETGATLEDNSLFKAQTVFDYCGLPTIADDTGLEVDALNGEPGVYSARYAGMEISSIKNIEKLLNNLKDKDSRKARFRTVFTYIDQAGLQQFEGIVEGQIAQELHGQGGFGYDPVFFPEGEQITFAQMTLDDKNKRSHRARALEKLIHYLSNKQI